MPRTIVVGGFGSSPEQMKYQAHRMSEHLDEEVIGISFREASQNIKRLASLIVDGHVYTHSGGFSPVVTAADKQLVLPDRLVCIAPPVREQIPKLLWRGALIQLGLGTEKDEQLEKKFSATDELVHHPLANFGRIPGLSQFSAIAEAARMQQHGVDTTVALMEDESLFDLSTRPVELSIARARKLGTKVVSISGDHCRFTHDPIGVLGDIELSSQEAATVQRQVDLGAASVGIAA